MKSAVRLLISIGIISFIAVAYQNCGSFEVGEHLKGQASLGEPPGKSVTVSFALSKSSLVNSAGGGYRVYYSNSGTVTKTSDFVDVPFSAALQSAPKAKIKGLTPGSYKIAVSAYSAQNKTGSELSDAKSILVTE